MSNREEKVIFAFAPGGDSPDGVPTLTFIMPEEAWHYMRTGMGHEFDLTMVGIPLRVAIGRTKNHASGIKLLEQMNGGPMAKAKNVMDADLSFGQKPKQ
jgi:hypothetical protein